MEYRPAINLSGFGYISMPVQAQRTLDHLASCRQKIRFLCYKKYSRIIAGQAQIYGVRPSRTFEQAAAKYVLEHQHKRSIKYDVVRLENLMPWIGHSPLEKLHRGSLEPWVYRFRNILHYEEER